MQLTVFAINSYYPSHVPVQTNFRRYVCYISLNQAQTHLDHLKVLDKPWSKISVGFETVEEFPHELYCKNRPHSGMLWGWTRAIFTMSVYGEIFTRCRIWMKFRQNVCLKHSNDRCEFWAWLNQTIQKYRRKFICTGTWEE